MGDTGSQLIGFSVIVLALNLTQGQTPLSPLLPLLIIGFPILDTAAVMVERVMHRRPLFVADKNHLHHKLMGFGLFHTEAVLAIYLAQAAFVIAALVFRFYSDWLLLSGYVFLSVVILGGSFVAVRKKWHLKRQGIVDRVIKGRLRVLKEGLKERRVFIRVAFAIVKTSLPLLLLVACLLPVSVPGYFAIVCAVAGAAIVLSHLVRKPWGKWILPTALYLFIPFIVFLGEAERASWFVLVWQRLYNASYLVLALFMLLTLRWTGRREGFRMTPMDFLIVFIVVAASLLPEEYSKQHHLGAVATRIVTLFFAYEVLIGELRDELGLVAWSTAGALFLVALRGLLGI
jgi:UDP-GlcNAc:undecaprenyl-phosphate GlcNAc-1-phosphate transferase